MKQEIDYKKILGIVIIGIILYLGLKNFATVWEGISAVLGIISPFILGACLAFIINIPMRFFERKLSKIKNKKGKTRLSKGVIKGISLCLAIAVIVVIFALIIRLVVPELINVIQLLIERMPYYIEEIGAFLENATKDIPDINTIISNMNIDVEQLKQQAIEIATNFLTSSISVITSFIAGVINFVIALIFAIYILVGKQKLKNQLKKLLYAYLKKEKADRIIEIGKLSRSTFRNFIMGQCLEATILGVLCILGMLVLKIPYAASIGVLVGATALIPIFGAFIGAFIGAILIVSVEPIKVITFIIFIIILQQVEGNLIYPKVMGNSVGIPGIWVLVAVTIGGSLFGVFGMLIGLPIASILYTILKQNTNKRIEEKYVKEIEIN